MPRVIYLADDGTTREVIVRGGSSVMEGALRAGVPGIDAKCGGACACATCCVFIDQDWAGAVPPPNGIERSLIDAAAIEGDNVRLSCQIRMTQALDGLVVRVPRTQR